MNHDELIRLIEESPNLADAAKRIKVSTGALRGMMIANGIDDYTHIINYGEGIDIRRDRRRIDGFEQLTDWEKYNYRKSCERNEMNIKKTNNPNKMYRIQETWVPRLNLEGNSK